MILQELLESQLGIKTDIRINPLTSQIGREATQLLIPNPNRLAWTLINLGKRAAYVSFTPDVGEGKGIYVAPTGGVLSLLWNEDFSLVCFPVYAVATEDVADIYLVEVLAI